MKKKNNLFAYIISMGLPAIILTGVLLFVGNYPFGNNNFALWDMDYQYLDFFQWLKRVVNGEANIAYSFGKSLGDNTIGLWSFYLSSPFNLLLFFFIPMVIQLLNGKGIEHEKIFRFQFRRNIWDVVKALFPLNAMAKKQRLKLLREYLLL